MPVLFDENSSFDSSAENDAPVREVVFMNCSIEYWCFGRAVCAGAICAGAVWACARLTVESAAIRARAEAEVTLIRPPSEVMRVASWLMMPEPGLTDIGHGQEPRTVWRIFDAFDGRRNHLFEGDESEPQRGDAP